jgi:ABC-type transport system involved in cytochrome c biogenesis permease subunit
MYIYVAHLSLAFGWAFLLLTFIKSMQHEDKVESAIFGLLSFLMMIAVLVAGVMIMLNIGSSIHKGYWLRVKLSIDIILMGETLFLLYLLKKGKFVSRKCGNIMYIFTFIAFIVMILLTMLKPF